LCEQRAIIIVLFYSDRTQGQRLHTRAVTGNNMTRMQPHCNTIEDNATQERIILSRCYGKASKTPSVCIFPGRS
jgi:hypothetical protein